MNPLEFGNLKPLKSHKRSAYQIDFISIGTVSLPENLVNRMIAVTELQA
jgi:hypothetical protein